MAGRTRCAAVTYSVPYVDFKAFLQAVVFSSLLAPESLCVIQSDSGRVSRTIGLRIYTFLQRNLDIVSQGGENMSDVKSICKVFRLLRIANDLSIKELSEKTGISVSYITDMEKGVKTKPSVDIIEKYSNALGVSKSTIMFFEEEYARVDCGYQKMLLAMLEKIVK